MKSYIAYGKNGKNKIFETQTEAIAFFNLNSRSFAAVIAHGFPVTAPDTQEVYFLDELINLDEQYELLELTKAERLERKWEYED